jgi:hypothetical protein
MIPVTVLHNCGTGFHFHTRGTLCLSADGGDSDGHGKTDDTLRADDEFNDFGIHDVKDVSLVAGRLNSFCISEKS